MGAERSSEKTKVAAEPAVAARVVSAEPAAMFAAAFVARGYDAKVAGKGKVETTAPGSVVDSAIKAYESRGKKKSEK